MYMNCVMINHWCPGVITISKIIIKCVEFFLTMLMIVLTDSPIPHLYFNITDCCKLTLVVFHASVKELNNIIEFSECEMKYK